MAKETKFAGPACFQRGDNNYYTEYGSLIARQRSTAIRYNPELAVAMGAMDKTENPVWSDAELAKIERPSHGHMF